eukprot:Pgem_evm1s18407
MTSYSIWLSVEDEGNTIVNCVKELSETFKGPVFTPHITILGSIKDCDLEV